MKKSILILAALITVVGTTSIVAKKVSSKKGKKIEIVDSKDINKVMVFDAEEHDFGTLKEGVKATHVFTFVNHGKEALVIQNARPSCGCTTPSWSKEPVKSGTSGTITAVYNTNGRPGAFNKSITVTTNLGTKVLKIKGSVTAAPKQSTPTKASLIKK